jgi:hypothetical protein
MLGMYYAYRRVLVPLRLVDGFDSAISSLEGLIMGPETINQNRLGGGTGAAPDEEEVPRNLTFLFQPP